MPETFFLFLLALLFGFKLVHLGIYHLFKLITLGIKALLLFQLGTFTLYALTFKTFLFFTLNAFLFQPESFKAGFFKPLLLLTFSLFSGKPAFFFNTSFLFLSSALLFLGFQPLLFFRFVVFGLYLYYLVDLGKYFSLSEMLS